MKPLGNITRGTTNPNRLRRIDVWMAWRYQSLLRNTPQPLVVDLGFGATPITTLELADRLQSINREVQLIGLEIDRDRVARAQESERRNVRFEYGGFEIPTERRPHLVRALNVLRQYPEEKVHEHWRTMQQRLSNDGFLIEGTCDELGRRAVWVEVDQQGPLTLTFACNVRDLRQPSDLAPRLPKILIHRNVPGEPIHHLLNAMDRAWHSNASLAVYGKRQQWAGMIRDLRRNWPIITPASRGRHGEITFDWRVTSEVVEHR